MATFSTSPPVGLRWRSTTIFILFTVGIALFTDLFLYGIIVPILPFILEDRLGVEKHDVQTYTSLLIACYAGASFLFSLPAGIIADKLPSRQMPFLAGLGALMASTTLLFLGQSITVLIIARIFQGISGAVVWTVGMALILDTVGSKKLGVTIGSIFSILGVGELLAPVVGGVVYQKFGNGAVFGLALGLLAVDFSLRLAVIEKKIAAKWGIEEVPRVESTENGESGHREEPGEESPLMQNIGQKFESWKIKEEQPTYVRKFPILYCLSDPRLLVAQAITFVSATLLAVFDATLPIQARDLFGFDSLKAGLLFVPQILPYLLLGPIAGRAVDKYGVKPIAVMGLGFLVIPLILLRIPHEGGTAEVVKFCAILALCGVGLGLIGAPGFVEASYVTEQYFNANEEFFGGEAPYAQLYAINSMVFSLGLTLGPLIAGSLKDAIGYGNMNLVGAGLCLVVSILSFVYLGGKPRILQRTI